MNIIHGIFGMAVLIGIAWLFSNDRKNINWNLVGRGLLLQFGLGVFILLGTDMVNYLAELTNLPSWIFWATIGLPKLLFDYLATFFTLVIAFTTHGAEFVFGALATPPGEEGSMGSFFAFQVLPTIVFFASLSTVLYHYGILQKVVAFMSTGMRKLMGVSGAESLSVTGNIFIGQTESPLLIRPFIKGLTKSELLAVMTGGMATIAGGIMAAYISMLGEAYSQAMGVPLEEGRQLFAEHLLGASIMAAPGALVIAKIFFPERETPKTMGDRESVEKQAEQEIEEKDANGIDAAASGALEGLKLALNVGAMLIAFLGLIAMFNHFLGWFGDGTGLNSWLEGIDQDQLSIQLILGWIFWPVSFVIGIPFNDVLTVASLIGIKIVSTEFIAYSDLTQLMVDQAIEPRTIAMATFALCGFANFASIAIQIGGIGGLAPDRKAEIAAFGLKAVLAGNIVNLMNAAIAGILY